MYIPQVFNHQGVWTSRLSVEGMKCLSCVHKIKEHLYQSFDGIFVDIQLMNKSVEFKFKSKPNIEKVVNSIEKLGFSVQPYRNHAFRENLVQIALAFYVAGNVMLLSIAEYFAKIDAPFDRYFRLICLVLTSLTLIFSAKPLWLNAYAGLKARKIEIDTGILLGFISAYIFSAVNVLNNHGEVYFDSIAIAVVLILVGRFVRNQVLEESSHAIEDDFFQDPEYCQVKNGDEVKPLPVNKLKKKDRILIRAGDLIPVDAKVIKGHGSIDLSSINGESEQKICSVHSLIPSGAYSVSGSFELECLKDGATSYVLRASSICKDLINKQSLWQSKANKIAAMFLTILLCSVLILLVGEVGGDLKESIRRSISLLLVACPCALGFGIPLAFAKVIAQLSKKGVVVQNMKGLEYFKRCKTIVFDKTGTLTEVNLELSELKIYHKDDFVFNFTAGLDQYSSHHVPKLLSHTMKHLAHDKGIKISPEPMEEYVEIAGKGSLAKSSQRSIKLGKASFTCQNCEHAGEVHLNIDDKCVLTFNMQEKLSPGSEKTLASLLANHFEVYILSGDVKEKSLKVAKRLNIQRSHVMSNQSPEEKLSQVIGKDTIIVGNGLNDMLAFSGGRISIAVSSTQAIARKKSDFYLSRPELTPILDIIHAVNKLHKNLKKLYIFSFAYNMSALLAACFGSINPLIAAIIMPINSLITVKIATAGKVR